MATTGAAPFEDLTKLASDFVTSQKGMWDHAAWKDFLSRVQKNGVELSEDMQSSSAAARAGSSATACQLAQMPASAKRSKKAVRIFISLVGC